MQLNSNIKHIINSYITFQLIKKSRTPFKNVINNTSKTNLFTTKNYIIKIINNALIIDNKENIHFALILNTYDKGITPKIQSVKQTENSIMLFINNLNIGGLPRYSHRDRAFIYRIYASFVINKLNITIIPVVDNKTVFICKGKKLSKSVIEKNIVYINNYRISIKKNILKFSKYAGRRFKEQVNYFYSKQQKIYLTSKCNNYFQLQVNGNYYLFRLNLV